METAAIQALFRAIRNDNIDLLRKVLAKIPIGKLSQNQTDSLLQLLLRETETYRRPEAVQIIIQSFEAAFPQDQYRLPLYVQIFQMLGIELPVLAFVVHSLEDVTFADVISELITRDVTPMTVIACNRTDLIFGSQPVSTYRSLYEMAVEKENDVVANFMAVLLAEEADFAPIPDWVKDFSTGRMGEALEEDEKTLGLLHSDQVIVPGFSPAEVPLPDNEELVSLLTEGMGGLGIDFDDIENARETLRTQLSLSSREDRLVLAAPVLQSQARLEIGEDDTLFRILGPVNAKVDDDLLMNHKCSAYGGCRMLTCSCFVTADFDDDFDSVSTDELEWFHGSCESCFLRIRRRAHAFRVPRIHGGWKGCYCSSECAKSSDDAVGSQLVAIDPMIDRVEGQLRRIGIQDRLDYVSVDYDVNNVNNDLDKTPENDWIENIGAVEPRPLSEFLPNRPPSERFDGAEVSVFSDDASGPNETGAASD